MLGKALFTLVFSLSLVAPLYAHAATLSISPKTGTYEVGDRITVKILAQSDSPLNAVQGVVSFPSGLFSIESVSKSGSILNFWITEPTFSRGSGTVQFEGISLTGFQGGSGTVVSVTLRALKVGSGSVTFQSGQILANDGQGTDITGGLHGATYLIDPAKERPATKPAEKPIEVVVEPEVIASPTNIAPRIRLGEQDKYPAVLGDSDYPGAAVVLTFVPITGIKVYITGMANDQGSFVLQVPRALRDGPYAVSASMILKDKSETDSSTPLSVNIRGNVISQISFENATYASLVVLFLLLLLLSYYLWIRLGARGHIHQELRKEIREARDTLHKSFVLIREDVRKHRMKGEGRKGDGSVFNEDVSDIEDSLDDAEVMIEKEIQDIAMVDIDEEK